jgi:hypothetical protein
VPTRLTGRKRLQTPHFFDPECGRRKPFITRRHFQVSGGHGTGRLEELLSELESELACFGLCDAARVQIRTL